MNSFSLLVFVMPQIVDVSLLLLLLFFSFVPCDYDLNERALIKLRN